jgi:hypothetical protein
MSSTPRYVATLSRVREVSLVGTADLTFWKKQLGPANLAPAEFDGNARILVSASYATFMGLRFQEFSVCVLVPPPAERAEGAWPDAAYVLRGFSSRRFFAFCERALYSTPYRHARVRVSASFPPSVELAARGEGTYRAAMRAGAGNGPREPSRSGNDGWSGPVFLPERGAKTGGAGKLFFANIQGHTRAYPYLPSRDELEITSSAGANVFRLLIDSGFAGQEWVVREDATHAKTKTYPAQDALASFRPDSAPHNPPPERTAAAV